MLSFNSYFILLNENVSTSILFDTFCIRLVGNSMEKAMLRWKSRQKLVTHDFMQNKLIKLVLKFSVGPLCKIWKPEVISYPDVWRIKKKPCFYSNTKVVVFVSQLYFWNLDLLLVWSLFLYSKSFARRLVSSSAIFA